MDEQHDTELRRRSGLLEELEELGRAAATGILSGDHEVLDQIADREGELSDMLGLQGMDQFWTTFFQSCADILVELPSDVRGVALRRLVDRMMADALAAGAFEALRDGGEPNV